MAVTPNCHGAKGYNTSLAPLFTACFVLVGS